MVPPADFAERLRTGASPFSGHARPAHVPILAWRGAVAQLLAAIGRRAPLTLMTGPAGSGKSTGLIAVAEELEGGAALVIARPGEPTLRLLADFCMALGLPAPADSQALAATIAREVAARRAARRALALLVDDAHRLDDVVLRQLHALSRVEGGRVLQLVLVGPSGFRERLVQPQLRAVYLGVAAEIVVGGVTDENAAEYVRLALGLPADAAEAVFQADAARRLAREAAGDVRRFRSLAALAWRIALAREGTRVTEGDAERACRPATPTARRVASVAPAFTVLAAPPASAATPLRAAAPQPRSVAPQAPPQAAGSPPVVTPFPAARPRPVSPPAARPVAAPSEAAGASPRIVRLAAVPPEPRRRRAPYAAVAAAVTILTAGIAAWQWVEPQRPAIAADGDDLARIVPAAGDDEEEW